MYFRWKDRRIVIKVAVWGAEEGLAAPFLHTLADAVAERVDNGSLDAPESEGAVGLSRNGEALSVDEEDRKFTLFLCHPSAATGTFRETPVDYKLVAPEAPVAENRAFDSVLRDASGVLFLPTGEPTADAAALEALSEGLASAQNAVGCLVRVLLSPRGTEVPDPEEFRHRHDLPEGSEIELARTWTAGDAWSAFVDLTHQVRPLLERASDEQILPV